MRSGMFIEDPSHILGRLVDVANGRSEVFRITGTDYPTRDGTGIRDYLHCGTLPSLTLQQSSGSMKPSGDQARVWHRRRVIW